MSVLFPAVRTGFLHLAEALAYRRDTDVPLRAVIAMLKAGDRCNAEAELISKGTFQVVHVGVNVIESVSELCYLKCLSCLSG